MESNDKNQDVNPIRDVVFCFVWVGLFFTAFAIGCRNYKKEKDRQKAEYEQTKGWRYLDEPIEDQRIIWRPHKVDTNIRNAIRANLFREY